MKTYRIINRFLMGAIILSGLSSCTDSIMDDINENKNNPEDVPSRLILTDVMTSSAFSITGSDYQFYASCYMEHNVGVYGQMYNAEIRVSEPIASSTYNNSWNNSYTNLLNLKDAIARCSAGGSEDGNYVNLGIAQVLSAYNLAILTDLMGDTPWTESCQPGVIFQPKIDKQEDIYKDIMKFLDDAIDNLGKTTTYTNLGTQDLIYGGDAKKWTKFAYGLKARYTMRLSLIEAKYQDVIDLANKSFATEAEQCIFNYNGSTSNNPINQFLVDRDYFGSSQSLHNKLVDRNDPRDAKYFEAYPGTSALIFAPNGSPQQIQKYYGISALSSKTNPTYLMSFYELQFLKAEAYARLNQKDKAKEALQIALQSAFVKVGLTVADANNYLNNNISNRFETAPLAEIMMQKYLAFYEDESIEAYNDYRRLTAMGDNLIPLSNTKAFPLRYTYGSEDVTANKNVEAAYGNGQYVYTENVWWAGGTR